MVGETATVAHFDVDNGAGLDVGERLEDAVTKCATVSINNGGAVLGTGYGRVDIPTNVVDVGWRIECTVVLFGDFDDAGVGNAETRNGEITGLVGSDSVICEVGGGRRSFFNILAFVDGGDGTLATFFGFNIVMFPNCDTSAILKVGQCQSPT